VALKTIEWMDKKVVMIDQTKLPTEEVYFECKSFRQVSEAIRKMKIRGAPAIGIAGAMGVALGAKDIKAKDFNDFQRKFDIICDDLAKTRPTAVNLFWAIEKMREVVRRNCKTDIDKIKDLLKREAINMFEEDYKFNQKIGQYGKNFIKDSDSVLTHCNAGGLATTGYGTALGVIRAAYQEGKKINVLVDETRPILQGARLTTWELMKDRIPVTLITDNMVAYFMKEGKIDLVVVGADRISANGDVANKIGTYSIAILAREHDIPFYVAAPTSTIDHTIAKGEDIPLEERNGREVTHLFGKRIAPEGVGALNPAFDITPHEYITAIITERGVIKSPYRKNLKILKNKGLVV
jgi:methylthioribose-1-phosphate isomerase